MDKNARIAWTLVLVTAGMLGMAYAAVPLYQAFCRATGFAGTPLVAQSDDRPVISRTVKVRFDTNVDPGLAWRFEPEQRQVTVHLGEEKLVYFRATNLSQRPIVGAANYNVTPERTAGWFNKIQCFCFTEQLL
jgi:cytochrome c oxidase assembly protein subunit 11